MRTDLEKSVVEEIGPSSRQMPVLSCHVLDTGYCTVWENQLVTGGRKLPVRVHALAMLLHHPAHGWFLFDTGYAPRILDATQGYPFRAYRWVTPMTVTPELAVANQLSRFGLTPQDISRVVLSHFHADHVAGLLDFPSVRLVSGREAWMAVRALSSLRALSRGFVPALMPQDFESRVDLIGDFCGPELAPFGKTHDLFSDGSALLVRLPGHARGQLGLIAQTNKGRIFFVADSYYMPASIHERALPHPITRFFAVDDWAALGKTINHLADFAAANPDVVLLPTHCPEAFRKYAEPLA